LGDLRLGRRLDGEMPADAPPAGTIAALRDIKTQRFVK